MDSTKDKIITTGLTFFMEKGYEETALSDIAKDIGITKPALYYHFDSKDKLFEEVMIYFSSQIEVMFSGLISEAKNLEQGLSIFFSHLDNYLKQFSIMFQINVENIMLNFYFLIYDAVKRVPEFQQRIAKLYSNLSDEIEKIIKNEQEKGTVHTDIDAKTTAFNLVALTEGLLLMYIVNPELNLQEIGEKTYQNWLVMLKNR